MPELSPATQHLIEKYSLWEKSLKPKEGAPTVHVDEVAMKVAAFYEQIRTIIDWKEEHLMRRAAIIRKLKRRFLDMELNDFSGAHIAEPLVLELIRGGYFPNDKLEESKIGQVRHILEKYIFILKNSPENKRGRSGLQFYSRLLEIAACEIEETLAPSTKEMALIDYMFSQMQERIKISEAVYKKGAIKPEDKDIQIYIAVQRALFKLDAPIISYNLLKYKYPQWENPSEEELLKISQNITGILRNVEKDLLHPAAKKFYAICEKYDTPYLLLGDILFMEGPEKAAQKMKEPAAFESLVRNAYAQRLADLKKRISRTAIYTIVSIFITKILSLVILEIILAKIFSEPFNIFFLIADILIPTVLMAMLVITVKPPSKKNLHVVIMETIKIIYRRESTETYEIKIRRKQGVLARSFLSAIYVLGAFISFGFIFWIFNYFDFPITSIVINIIFIALILFAGTAVKTRSEELTIEPESEGFLGFASDVLLLPVAALGQWLSNTWKQYNAIAAFFNALIDMPFSAFVEFLERWRYFIKEKKEELR